MTFKSFLNITDGERAWVLYIAESLHSKTQEEVYGRAVSELGVIAEAKQRSQWSVIVWVTKIYYLDLLRGSRAIELLIRWSLLHLHSLALTPVSRRIDVRQAVGRKNNCRIFITTS
jgi:hypothetical protein